MATKEKPAQLILYMEVCHFKGCRDPVVCSSTAKQGKYVCDHHNNLEWATSLARWKAGGYWQHMGQQWLRELEKERGTKQ